MMSVLSVFISTGVHSFLFTIWLKSETSQKPEKNNSAWKMLLLQAVSQNNVDRVKELLAEKATNVNVRDNHNFSGNF